MKKTILTAAVVLACALCLSGPQAAEAAAPKTRVLLIGDSIAVYYTPYVKKLLEGQVKVERAGHAVDTKFGLANIDRMLRKGPYDVIHFNWGLHDLKPVGKRAARRQEDVKRYNAVARKVMGKEGIPIDDLYSLARPQLDRIQKKDNVHFEDAGCEVLAGAVARSIVAVLAGRKTWTPPAVTFAGTLAVTRNAKDEIASATLTDAAGETYRVVLDTKGKELAAKLADRKAAVTGTVTIRNPGEQAAEQPLETMWLTVREHRPVDAGTAE